MIWNLAIYALIHLPVVLLLLKAPLDSNHQNRKIRTKKRRKAALKGGFSD